MPDAPNAKTADWTLDGALPLLTRAGGRKSTASPVVPIRWRPSGEAIEHGSFDEIIISTLPKRTSRWLRRHLPRRVQEFGLPVTVISADKDTSFLPWQEGRGRKSLSALMTVTGSPNS